MEGVHRNVLFDVFTHPTTKAFVAVGELQDKSSKVLIEKSSTASSLKIKCVTSLTALQLMASKLKSGYSRSKSSTYFDETAQSFTQLHPDMSWGGKDWILAVTPPSVQEGIDAVVLAMRQVPSNIISAVEIDAWAERQKSNKSQIIAFNDLPVWSLIVAETSLKEGWTFSSNTHLTGVPSLLPSMNPIEWDEWLQQVFNLKLVQRSRAAIGFTVDLIHKPDHSALLESENWSSLI